MIVGDAKGVGHLVGTRKRTFIPLLCFPSAAV